MSSATPAANAVIRPNFYSDSLDEVSETFGCPFDDAQPSRRRNDTEAACVDGYLRSLFGGNENTPKFSHVWSTHPELFERGPNRHARLLFLLTPNGWKVAIMLEEVWAPIAWV